MASQPHLKSVGNDGVQTFIGEVSDSPTAPNLTAPPVGGPPRRDGDGAGTRSAQRQRAERNLPTDRLSFEKQVEALRAIAQLSGSAKKPVKAETISASLGLKGNTGSLSNKFFWDTGWITPAGRGAYAATDELLAFNNHLGIDAEDQVGAKRYLLGSARGAWYWQEIETMVQGAGVREKAVLLALVKAAGASAERRQQMLLILDWLTWLGLIRRDGDIVVAGAGADQAAAIMVAPETEAEPENGLRGLGAEQAEVPVDALDEQSAPEASTPTRSTPSVPLDDAMVSMNFSVRITADDAVKLNEDQLRTLLEFAEKMRH